MNYEEIFERVEKLKKRYDNIKDPFALCKLMKIKLNPMSYGLSDNCIKGFTSEYKRVKSITYNSDLPYHEQIQILWHEIGHCQLHKNGTYKYTNIYDYANDVEKEANLFSAEYQIDDNEVLEALNEGTTFGGVASILNIPVEVLDFKFRMMKWKGYKITPPPKHTKNNYLKNFSMPKSEYDYYD